ncbi:MAG TPA: sulfite exporter TauE/SafE family protein [Candidatus Bathyarchaeia archaeon]|nr:sulfite exporter TauE/SafE family protein [Candidatus Bathyarchaeia archaeon]
MVEWLGLMVAGLVIGAYGTVIGAGGGFILVPLLLLFYPHESPDSIASVSLAVVFFNALSGTLAYARLKRVDYGSGVLLSVATIPGAIVGALTTGLIPRRPFDILVGVLLITVSAFLMIRPVAEAGEHHPGRFRFARRMVDRDGAVNVWSYNPFLGFAVSVVIGFVSSLLGIGGGFIHVPVMINLLNFPVHVAAATSHFTLTIMTFVGSIVHLVTGTLAGSAYRVVPLAMGVIVGAQVGARLAQRLHGAWIVRALVMALVFVGLRLIIKAL